MASGQGIVVVGQVLSAEDASPLAAANVWFKGTGTGTTTNEEGFFLLRSNEPQKVLMVSVVGYRKRSVRLDYGKDQMVEVLMVEETSLLDEIVVLPQQDDAIELLARVRKNRAANDPSNFTGIGTVRRRERYANITNVRGAAFRRRLFADLESGAIAQTDTNYSLPVYALSTTENIAVMPDSTAVDVADRRENAVELLETDSWGQLLESYIPTVNPYRPYTTILGSNFLNPTASSARNYYNIYIADSTASASGKRYSISFKPKRDEGLLFSGSMEVDSATAAITDVRWRVPASSPVNFLKNYSYTQRSLPFNATFFPESERQMLDLQLMSKFSKSGTTLGAIVSDSHNYSGTRLLSDSLSYKTASIIPDSVVPDDAMQAMWAGIDSLNQTRIKKLAAWAVDIILNQYLHIWKIDVGPLLNLFHYNELEGASPRLTLRSGKSFAKNFSFGGYYGYGFKDKRHKFGGQIQWKFGPQKRNYLAFHYDHRVERYGFDDVKLYAENRVHDIDHLGNSWDQIKVHPTLAMRERMRIDYAYETKGFRLGLSARGENIYSNPYMPYLQNGRIVDRMSLVGLKADVRLSWKQRVMDEYFHRIYLRTPYPVVRLAAEGGGITVGEYALLYGKFDVYAYQNVPVGFGRLRWSMQASATVGAVPWPLLTMARTSRSAYFHDTDFALLNQMELASDLYIAANLRYQTRGYIFGYIPYIKKLGIREDLIFKIAYGRLADKHNSILALPTSIQPWNNMPYIEAGFGLSNILYLGDIQFLWRVTHRNNPMGTNFGVHWRLSLDF